MHCTNAGHDVNNNEFKCTRQESTGAGRRNVCNRSRMFNTHTRFGLVIIPAVRTVCTCDQLGHTRVQTVQRCECVQTPTGSTQETQQQGASVFSHNHSIYIGLGQIRDMAHIFLHCGVLVIDHRSAQKCHEILLYTCTTCMRVMASVC